MDPHAWLSGYDARLTDIAARAATAQRELAAVSATATGRDGAVTATVEAGGALAALRFGPAADQLGRGALAEQVVATVAAAREEAARQAARAVTGLVGDDSEAMRLVRASSAAGGKR